MPLAPVSTIPSVKAYMVTQIRARTELTTGIADGSILVCYDAPGPFQPDDIIAVMDAETDDMPVVQLVGGGLAGWLDEHYTLTIVVSVHRGGDDPQTVFERAAALAAIVVDVVRQDPSLGGRVIVAKPQQLSFQSDWAMAPLEEDGGEVLYTGRLTDVAVPISVTARI